MTKKKKAANPVGRPSKYNPKYCARVVMEMANGKSLTAFAADIDVDRDTITEWCNVHPDFSLAVRKGKAKCAAWWEQRGRDIAEKGGGSGSATLAIFGMKNMAADDWREKSEVDIKLPDLTGLSLDDLAAVRKAAENAARLASGGNTA